MLKILRAKRLLPSYFVDNHGGIKGLVVLRAGVYIPDDIHSPYYFPECGISLPVRIVVSTKIKSRLIAYADKKFGAGCSGSRSC